MDDAYDRVMALADIICWLEVNRDAAKDIGCDVLADAIAAAIEVACTERNDAQCAANAIAEAQRIADEFGCRTEDM